MGLDFGGLFGGGKRRRRERLRRMPLEPDLRAVLRTSLSACSAHLDQAAKTELEGLVQIFLAEKHFEGCGGQVIDADIRLTIAGHACLLLLGRDTDLYPALDSILVYPTTYMVDHQEIMDDGTVLEEEQEMLGESWRSGALVLSWEDVRADLADPNGGCNVILHEFAHQLDDESGEADGTPLLDDGSVYARWHDVLGREFEALRRAVERDEETFLDPYGTENPAEFFATTTEAFFLLPDDLRHFHPALYEEFRDFYRQDPAGGD